MLVLLHGFGGSPEIWTPVIAHLAPGARTLALPLPGHDPSSPLQEDASFDGAVAALHDRLPPACELLGYSLGARLALELALRAPDRVRRLSLVGVHPGLERPEDRAVRAASDHAWAERLRRDGLGAFFEAWDASPLFEGRARLAPARQAHLAAIRARHDPAQLARALETLSLAQMPHDRARFARLVMPVALVAGALDSKFRALAEALAPALPTATLHVVPEVGHDVPFEAPDRLAAFIRGFHGMG